MDRLFLRPRPHRPAAPARLAPAFRPASRVPPPLRQRVRPGLPAQRPWPLPQPLPRGPLPVLPDGRVRRPASNSAACSAFRRSSAFLAFQRARAFSASLSASSAASCSASRARGRQPPPLRLCALSRLLPQPRLAAASAAALRAFSSASTALSGGSLFGLAGCFRSPPGLGLSHQFEPLPRHGDTRLTSAALAGQPPRPRRGRGLRPREFPRVP